MTQKEVYIIQGLHFTDHLSDDVVRRFDIFNHLKIHHQLLELFAQYAHAHHYFEDSATRRYARHVNRMAQECMRDKTYRQRIEDQLSDAFCEKAWERFVFFETILTLADATAKGQFITLLPTEKEKYGSNDALKERDQYIHSRIRKTPFDTATLFMGLAHQLTDVREDHDLRCREIAINNLTDPNVFVLSGRMNKRLRKNIASLVKGTDFEDVAIDTTHLIYE